MRNSLLGTFHAILHSGPTEQQHHSQTSGWMGWKAHYVISIAQWKKYSLTLTFSVDVPLTWLALFYLLNLCSSLSMTGSFFFFREPLACLQNLEHDSNWFYFEVFSFWFKSLKLPKHFKTYLKCSQENDDSTWFGFPPCCAKLIKMFKQHDLKLCEQCFHHRTNSDQMFWFEETASYICTPEMA